MTLTYNHEGREIKPASHHGYDLEQIEPYFLHAKEIFEWPNLAEKPVEQIASAFCGPARMVVSGGIKLPGERTYAYPHHAIYMLDRLQGGGYSGQAYVIWSGFANGTTVARAAVVSLCDHVRVSEPSADPHRGWHPAHCDKCGLNLTVDSGD